MQSVCSWEFEVQEDQIGPALLQQSKPVLPIDCLAHLHPQRFEVGADQLSHPPVMFNCQDALL